MNLRVLVLSLFAAAATTAWAEENYQLSEDSKPQDGVPKGTIKGPFEWKSEIYPGTVRNYWLYVPAQYDADKSACVFVVQDGLGRANGWKIPTVLDNLIHKGESPVQIGIFISPGVVPARNGQAQARYNRSFEYDAMGDRYARFLLEEILPEVSKSYNLSNDPNDRAIAGASSGAICAFGVAWERPNEFRRVLSTIGTYVSLRGGNEYLALVRKYEPKPIRVFLQDGSNDLNLYGGDWWMANQSMLSSLKFSGYDVRHAWGEGGHNGKHSTAIMPDAIRWLWHDYPEPIKPGVPPNRRTAILIPGEDWELVGDGYNYADSPAVNSDGEIFFADVVEGHIHKIDNDGQISIFSGPGEGIGGLAFAPDGVLYGCDRVRERIVRFNARGRMEVVIDEAPCNELVFLHNGVGYYTDPLNQRVWRFTADGKRDLMDEGIEYPNGVIPSPDQTQLFVSDTRGRFSYAWMIEGDGSLVHKQEYGHVHVPDGSRFSGANGWTVDTIGRRYLATSMGVQVFDQLGRCHLILTMPPDTVWMSNLTFAGSKRDTLYATCRDKVYRRKLKAKGVVPWEAPVKPPRPGL